jgi:hypothetical protein
MGTKNNPGKFDCYANAAPDEPMFVLLARDPMAPIVVRFWAQLRKKAGTISDAKFQEALDCAEAMADYKGEDCPPAVLAIFERVILDAAETIKEFGV